MAKEKEKKQARILYIELKKTAREIAEIVGVTEATVSTWVNSSGWKAERNAREIAPQNRIENIKLVVDGITQKRLQLSREIEAAEAKSELDTVNELRKQIAQIDAGIANWNKTLENLDKDGKISLAKYISIFEEIFEALRKYSPDLFIKTIDFQDKYLREISLNY